MHEHNKCHITTDNILRQYNTNFWTKGSARLAKLVTNKCLHCKLNTSRRKLLVKGTAREFETDMTPGRVWIGDLLYLPKSVEGHRFCFVMTERLTSYVCGLPLKSLSTPQVISAFTQFLSIMPQMLVMITDHGRGDFGAAFTQMCIEFGIQHGGSIPNRSQVQGSCEISNKILTNQLARICSSDNGKRHWPKSLAKAIQGINSYHPYKCPFSRTQLLFSPYIFQAKTAHMALNNPIKTIKKGYKQLNEKRIRNLLSRRGKSEKVGWQLGSYVLLNDEPQGKAESRGKLNIPHQ